MTIVSVTNLSCTAGTGQAVVVNGDNVSVDFTAPNAEGTCTFDYTISDTYYNSASPGTVTVSISNDKIVACQANWTPGAAGSSTVSILANWDTPTVGDNHNYTAPAGDDRILVVGVTEEGTAVPTVTATCTTMNALANTGATGGNSRTYTFYGLLGTSASTTSCNLTITNGDRMASAATFGNVRQVTGVGATNAIYDVQTDGDGGDSAAVTVTVNNPLGGYPVYVFNENAGANGSIDPSAGWTQIQELQGTGGNQTSWGVGTSTANQPSLTFTDTVSAQNRGSMVGFTLNPIVAPPVNATLDVLAANTTGLTNPVTATYNANGYAMSHVASTQWEMVGVTDISNTYTNSITITSTGDAPGMTCNVTNNTGAPSWPTIAVTFAEWDGANTVDVYATSTWGADDKLKVTYDGNTYDMTWSDANSRWEATITGYATFVAGNATVTSNAASNSPQALAVTDSTANIAPTAVNDTGYSVTENTNGNNLTGLLTNDNDGGDGPGALYISWVGNLNCGAGTGQAVSINGNLVSVDFDAPNAVTTCTFEYRANDTADDSNNATVTVNVTSAATQKTLYFTPSNGVNIFGVTTNHGACSDTNVFYREELSLNSGDLCGANYRRDTIWATTNHSEMFYNVTLAAGTTITGDTLRFTIRDATQVGIQLFLRYSDGSTQNLGSEVSQNNSGTNNYTTDISSQSGTIAASPAGGAKLGVRLRVTGGSGRIQIGNPDGQTGNPSGILTVWW